LLEEKGKMRKLFSVAMTTLIFLGIVMVAFNVQLEKARATVTITSTHDVAVVGVTPYANWTCQTRPINVNVTIANLGGYPENSTVNLYYNGTVGNGSIGTMYGLVLDPAVTENLTFTWNTNGVPISYSGYNITASIGILPEIDSNLANNVLQSPIKVQVRIVGDVNGDRTVNLADVYAVALHVGSRVGQRRYDPNFDLNGDGKIDLKDYLIVCINFGKTYE
jgi:hypothetical protein